jgi:hypothetical protein
MKKQLYRAAAATVLGLSLATGVAVADNSGSIDTTGPDSNNAVTATTTNRVTVRNDNDLNVRNDNDQRASSGDAKVWHNTTGGDATSGDASNANSTSVDATVDNSGAAMAALGGGGSMSASGDISNTGPDSNNYVTSTQTNTVHVTNDNDVRVNNDNDQHAYSGDAKVSDNTTGGSATSGSASNTNSSSFTFSISN